MTIQKVATFIAVLTLTLAPAYLFAQQPPQSGIVPCDGVSCTCQDLAKLANNVLTWIIYVMVFISAATFSYAGFRYLTAGGDSGQVSEASKMLKNVTKGIVLALIAWLVVDTTLRTLGNSTLYGMWSKICS